MQIGLFIALALSAFALGVFLATPSKKPDQHLHLINKEGETLYRAKLKQGDVIMTYSYPVIVTLDKSENITVNLSK